MLLDGLIVKLFDCYLYDIQTSRTNNQTFYQSIHPTIKPFKLLLTSHHIIQKLNGIKNAVLQLVFPHVCAGCGSDKLNEESQLCIVCLAAMPETNFYMHANNPVEK